MSDFDDFYNRVELVGKICLWTFIILGMGAMFYCIAVQ